jgi:RNA recognition motif-containing protein
MRRLKQVKTFKGSVFATFVDRETAEKFVKDEASSTYDGKPLVKMLQDEYWQAKIKETKEKRQVEKQAKLAKKLEQIAEQEKAAVQAKYEKGAVLEVSGLKNQIKYEELKAFFKTFGPVAFVAYETGDETVSFRILFWNLKALFRLAFDSPELLKISPRMHGTLQSKPVKEKLFSMKTS